MQTTSSKLPNKFVLWYRIPKETLAENQVQKHSLGEKEYEDQVKKLSEFDTLENFWEIFQYVKKPQDWKIGTEFQLFKDLIKPMWEDEKNKNGGRLGIKLRKEFTNLIWEEIVFGFIGGVLEKEAKDEVNGIVLSCKKDFFTLQIWFKNYEEKVYKTLEKTVREILEIPSEVAIEVKSFSQSDKGYNNNYNSFQRRQGGGGYYQKNQGYKNYNNKGNINRNNSNNYDKNNREVNKEQINEAEEKEKEKPKETPKEEPKEEVKEEVKEEINEEVKEEVKTETKTGVVAHKKKRKKDKKEAKEKEVIEVEVPFEEPKETTTTTKEEEINENGEEFKEVKKKKKIKKKE